MTDVSSADVPSEVPEPDLQAVSVDSAEAPAEAVDVPVEAPSDGVSAPVVEPVAAEVPVHEVDEDGNVVTPVHPVGDAPDPAVVDSSNTTHVVDAEGNLVLRNRQEA